MNITSLTSSLNPSAAKHFLHQSNIRHHEPRATNRNKLVLITCRATKSSCNYNKVQGGGEDESGPNFYKLLSLSPNVNASKDEIKRAYRSMALRYHPDVCHDRSISSTKQFVQLNEAYKTLSDPILREEYDYELGLRNYCIGTRNCSSFNMDNFRKQGAAQNRWRQQIVELTRRSNCRMAQKEGSWACRMRAQNFSTMD